MAIKCLRSALIAFFASVGVAVAIQAPAEAQQNNCYCPPGHYQYYGPGTAVPSTPADPGTGVQPVDPGAAPQVDIPGVNAPAASAQASSSGGASNSGVLAPNMIGDTAITNQVQHVSGGIGLLSAGLYSVGTPGGPLTRYKVSENTNPMPQDRIFFNYNHFHGAGNHNDGAAFASDGSNVDLNTYVFGVEKTFLCGMASAEIRIPFMSGYGADQMQGTRQTDTEFGNLGFSVKGLLWQDACRRQALTAGLTLNTPTGPDARLLDAAGTEVITIENESWRMAPYLAYYRQINSCMFTQVYFQWDFDLNGNTYFDADSGTGGVINDSDMMYIDVQVGYWIYRDNCPCSYIRGIAPVAELHYNTSISDADVTGVNTVGFATPRFDVLNLTGGLIVQVGNRSSINISAVAPLDDDERFFDAEYAIHMNVLY